MDSDLINALEEGLYVVLRISIMKKVLLETKGKMKYMIMSVNSGDSGPVKGNMVVTYAPTQEKIW